jgi:hypothetical protein
MKGSGVTSSRSIAALAGAALFLAAVLAGAYNYYYSDTFTTLNGSAWSVVGSVTPTANGLTAPGDGQLYSLLAVPDGTSEYEVKGRHPADRHGGGRVQPGAARQLSPDGGLQHRLPAHHLLPLLRHPARNADHQRVRLDHSHLHHHRLP